MALRKIANAPLPVLLTELGEVELANAISLRLFREELLPPQAEYARRSFRDDLENGAFRIVPFPVASFRHATRIAAEHTPQLGTRSIDVLHVAVAMALQAQKFYSFDQRQSRLARAEGLRLG